MFEIVGGILGGLGLFFVGMWLLSENLKLLAGRRLRAIAVNWVPNRFAACGYGVLAGGATQSMSSLTFITVGLLRANLTTTERAFPFIVGGNVGVVSMVFFVSFDIELAALYALGAASVFMLSQRTVRFRPLGAALFGVSLMFVGLALIKGSAGSFSTQPWFGEFLELAARSLWISFLLAAILTFIVQSTVAVMVFGVGLGAAGVLTAEQVMMLIYGSGFGSSLSVLALSFNLRGTSRRLAMFQVMFNFVSCAIFVPMLYIEIWTGAPLMKALILSIPLELASQLAMLTILTDASTAILILLMLPLMVKVYSRLWPATAIERLSQIEFVRNRAYGAVAVDLELAAKEQRRVLVVLASYLDAVRQGQDIESLRTSIRPVIREIDEFFTEVILRYPLQRTDGVNSMLAQQKLITWLEEQLAELCNILNQMPKEEDPDQLRSALVESIDIVVLVILDAVNSGNAEQWSEAGKLTEDRTELLRRFQNAYLEQHVNLNETERLNTLKAINAAGEIFYLLSRIIQEMEGFSTVAPPSPR